MTAVNGRHQARLFEDTRPIRRPTVRRVRRRRQVERYDRYAVVLAALGILFVALLNVVARGGFG